jgi:hypothetical protein
LGVKAEIDLIFTLLALDIRDPNMDHIFKLYQPFIGILHMTPKVVYTFYRRLGCAGVNVG